MVSQRQKHIELREEAQRSEPEYDWRADQRPAPKAPLARCGRCGTTYNCLRQERQCPHIGIHGPDDTDELRQ